MPSHSGRRFPNRRTTMGDLIVIEYTTLDGVVEDADGSEGTPGGGWLYRHGTDVLAGDKFELGSLLDTGVLLLGRGTWESFAQRWPNRTTEFATKLNTMPKLVASRTLTSVGQWQNSSLIEDDLVEVVRKRKAEQDVIVTGLSVVRTLAQHDLVDEYRLVVLPTVLGTGQRLFVEPTDLRLVSAEQKGAGAFLRYRRQAS
jgi:dihydrofolate reductase